MSRRWVPSTAPAESQQLSETSLRVPRGRPATQHHFPLLPNGLCATKVPEPEFQKNHWKAPRPALLQARKVTTARVEDSRAKQRDCMSSR